MNNSTQLIRAGRSSAARFNVSSILPFIVSKQGVETVINQANIAIKQLCAQENVSSVDNSPKFTVSDGSMNDALLRDDGFHPTLRGAKKLLNALGFATRETLCVIIWLSQVRSIFDLHAHRKQPRQSRRQQMQSRHHRHSQGGRQTAKRGERQSQGQGFLLYSPPSILKEADFLWGWSKKVGCRIFFVGGYILKDVKFGGIFFSANLHGLQA